MRGKLKPQNFCDCLTINARTDGRRHVDRVFRAVVGGQGKLKEDGGP